MEFEPISTMRLLALMAAGGLFACAGLYMMLRPRPEGAAKIELFGLKFESSSAGLLVFAVGAAFLATPLYVPEKADVRGAARPGVTPSEAVSPPVASGQTPKGVNGGETSMVLAEAPVVAPEAGIVQEVEPNDLSRQATQIRVGQTANGIAGYQDLDWFALPVPETGLTGHEISLRYVTGTSARVDVYNTREQNVGFLEVEDGVQYLPITSQFSGTLYFRVKRNWGAGEAHYELAVMPPG